MVDKDSGSGDVSEAGLRVGDRCICLTDDWADLKNYRVRSVGAEIALGPWEDVTNASEPRLFKRDEASRLLVSPYSLSFRMAHRELGVLAYLLLDLASSHLRVSGPTKVSELIDKLGADERLKRIPAVFVDGCLRCCVASGFLVLKLDRRRKNPPVLLELSPNQREVEVARVFAATLASELSSLSERIRNLIRHTSTVGTYRENLLQMLLRKHLPERYHVATGFIFGCPRQLDVIIYDRVDYAPVFREGDLVVVPPESVRAVIEVKTNLKVVELKYSLQQIEEVSALDDCMPPFFKGVFAFESDLEDDAVLQEVVKFYTEEPEENPDEDGLGLHYINDPYRHITSLCVLGSTYGHVGWERDSSGRFHPVLFSAKSATDLKPQAAFFLEALLAYLRFKGLKPIGPHTISTMLGADTQITRVGRLTRSDWGPYFALEHGLAPDAAKEVAAVEATVMAVQEWLDGSEWQTRHSPDES